MLPRYNAMVCTVLKFFSPDFTELTTFSCPITQTPTLLTQTWTQISTINIQALKYARTSLHQPREFTCKPHSKVCTTTTQVHKQCMSLLCFAFKDF